MLLHFFLAYNNNNKSSEQKRLKRKKENTKPVGFYFPINIIFIKSLASVKTGQILLDINSNLYIPNTK